MLTLIGSLAGLVSLGLHLFQGWSKLKNAPAMQANAQAQVIEQARAEATAAVASGDLKRIQKGAADADQ